MLPRQRNKTAHAQMANPGVLTSSFMLQPQSIIFHFIVEMIGNWKHNIDNVLIIFSFEVVLSSHFSRWC